MLAGIKIKFLKRFFRLALFWWKWWSLLFRRIHHSKYDDTKLPKDLGHRMVLRKLMQLKWTKDGTKELWDACGSPHWVQYAINQIEQGHGQPEGGLDCDDFASWATATLSNAYNPKLLQVAWLDKDGLPRGHVMCMARHPKTGKLFHIGNWGKSKDRDFAEELVEDVLVSANASTLIGWSIMHRDLSVIRWNTWIPLSSPIAKKG